MDVKKLMVVALAGWTNQQEHVPEDWKTTLCRI